MTVALDTLTAAPADPRATLEMVTMRDGVQLATDVYLPDRPGRLPTVLVRLPYDKGSRYTFMPALVELFAERGYVFVVQDVRGRFASGGETRPFVHEVEDGYDTISWLVDQPWCNGSVGMFGDSYYGFTQWAAVASGHPALKAIVPRVTTAELGSWMQSEVPSLVGARYLAEIWSDRLMHEWAIDWSRRPLVTLFDDAFEAIGARSLGFDDMMAAAREGRSVHTFEGVHPLDRVSIPCLHMCGWFDNLTAASMRDYARLAADPHRAALQFLSVDSVDHENYHLDDVPIAPESDHDQDDAALARMLPRYVGPALDFFDVFLAGTRPASTLPRVRWHVGHEGWRESASWPPAGARPRRLYLGEAERATADADGGTLADEPGPAAEISWVHDPGDLVPSTVENPFAFLAEAPDESSVQARADVATFTTAALPRDLVLAGPVTAHLGLRGESASMHAFAKLSEVAPDGRALMIARGQVMVGADAPAGATRIELGHVGIRIAAGQRLRLQVAASDFPLHAPHPGTEESPWFATETRPNRITLGAGGERDPSALELTVLDDE